MITLIDLQLLFWYYITECHYPQPISSSLSDGTVTLREMAIEVCDKSWSGHLLAIETEEEQNFLKAIFIEKSAKYIYNHTSSRLKKKFII